MVKIEYGIVASRIRLPFSAQGLMQADNYCRGYVNMTSDKKMEPAFFFVEKKTQNKLDHLSNNLVLKISAISFGNRHGVPSPGN